MIVLHGMLLEGLIKKSKRILGVAAQQNTGQQRDQTTLYWNSPSFKADTRRESSSVLAKVNTSVLVN